MVCGLRRSFFSHSSTVRWRRALLVRSTERGRGSSLHAWGRASDSGTQLVRVWADAFERNGAMTMNTTPRALSALFIAGTLVLSACAGMSQKQRGAVVGAATGAAVGGVIGNQTGSTAKGAIIGAVIGGTAGAIIGHQMDQQAKELSQTIKGATVERVGEGINVTFASGLLFAFNSDSIQTTAGANLSELAASLNR